jgi:hypothetical protein
MPACRIMHRSGTIFILSGQYRSAVELPRWRNGRRSGLKIPFRLFYPEIWSDIHRDLLRISWPSYHSISVQRPASNLVSGTLPGAGFFELCALSPPVGPMALRRGGPLDAISSASAARRRAIPRTRLRCTQTSHAPALRPRRRPAHPFAGRKSNFHSAAAFEIDGTVPGLI